jgi:hypothetical protein
MDAFEGSGCNPRLTTPRTMCWTSASGCSTDAEGLAAFKRPQSVFDFTEVDLRFALCGLSERDDADFIVTLRMND